MRRRLAPQFYYYLGRFGLMGEYTEVTQQVRRRVDATTSRHGTLQHSAWEVTASWFLTGEEESFGAFMPLDAFALELVALLDPLEPRVEQRREGEVRVAGRVGAVDLRPRRLLGAGLVERDPDQGRAVALRPRDVHGCLVPGHEPLVGVDPLREHGDRRCRQVAVAERQHARPQVKPARLVRRHEPELFERVQAAAGDLEERISELEGQDQRSQRMLARATELIESLRSSGYNSFPPLAKFMVQIGKAMSDFVRAEDKSATSEAMIVPVALTTAEMRALSTAALHAFTTDQMQAFETADLAALTMAQTSSFSGSQLAALSGDQLDALISTSR